MFEYLSKIDFKTIFIILKIKITPCQIWEFILFNRKLIHCPENSWEKELISGIEWIQDKFTLDYLNVQKLALMSPKISGWMLRCMQSNAVDCFVGKHWLYSSVFSIVLKVAYQT